MTQAQILTVTADTVASSGFFCRMSARTSDGYARKRSWLDQRFAEGLQMRMLGDGERGFVEFIPGRYAWRAVENADDFVMIHCLWVVGRSRGRGFGGRLLDTVEDWAAERGFRGVAMVTSNGTWLADSAIFEARGYVSVDGAGPGFDLMVRKFDRRINAPRFCGDFQKKRSAYSGVVVYRSDQCPYNPDAARIARSHAEDHGLAYREVPLDTVADVRALAPTPYGTFAIVQDGKLVSYHYLQQKQFPVPAAA